MSSNSYSTTCPNCKKTATACSDNRPFDQVGMECLYCGFSSSTYADYMDLDELNERRVDAGMKPLKRLPKQDETYKI